MKPITTLWPMRPSMTWGTGAGCLPAPRDEGFYVDLGAIFDLLQLRSPGVDGTAGKNVHSIAIEVPIPRLTKDGSTPMDPADDAAVIGVWSSASRPTFSLLPSSPHSPYRTLRVLA